MNLLKKSRKISSLFRVYSVGFTLVAGLIFILTFSYFEIKGFQESAQKSKTKFLEAKKYTLKDEVDKVLEYIDRSRMNLEEKMKQNLKDKVNQAWDINQSIYQKNKSKLTRAQIKKVIKDVLRPITFFNNRGYYFIVSMNGVEELYPPMPHLEDIDLTDMKDMRGHAVIKNEIEIIKKQNEGFVTSYWRKPGDEQDRTYPKTYYVKYFEPLDWYIGTGEYLDNYEKDLQTEVIERIKQTRFSDDGHIFINTYDNIAVVINSLTKKAGDNLTGLTDNNGLNIMDTQKKLALQKNGGFYEYYWVKPGANTAFPKLSYVKGFDEWKWIIGADLYIDKIDKQITEERESLYKHLGFQIAFVLTLFIIVLVFVLIISARISKKIQHNFETFTTKLRDAVWSGKILESEDYSIKDIEKIIETINNIIISKIKAEKLLAESENRLRSILENAPVLIALFDENFRYLGSNKEAKKYFYLPEVEEKADIKDIITSNNIDEHILDQFLNLDGRFREVEVPSRLGIKMQNWSFLKNENNEIIAVGYDITELKENQERLNELNETKDKFFSIISHDLIGPFNTIVGLSDLLQNEYEYFEKKKQLEIIKQINSSATGMYKMLSDLLKWATTQTGLIENNPEKFRLNDIVTEVVKILTPQAYEKSIIIKNNIDDELWLYADRSMTNTVIQNLVANSIKFTNKDGFVELNAQATHKEVMVSVADNGLGMKDEIVKSIFTLNKEKKQKGTANESGTGLGLVICKDFIEKMGGRIWVESKIGKGSTFYFTLSPLKNIKKSPEKT